MTGAPSRARISGLSRFWADRPLAFKGLVVIALPLAILFAALVSLYAASTAEVRAENDVRRAFAVQRDFYQVHAQLAEAAAGVRGYALTGQQRFLEPYHKAERTLPVTLRRLEGEIHDAEVKRRFESIRSLAVQKREGLAAIVALAQDRARTSAIEAALIDNKVVLDAMREEIGAIQERENILLDERRARVDDVRMRFLMLTVFSAVVGLLSSLAAVYLFSTGIVRRVRTLEGNAELLADGRPLMAPSPEADEIGSLSQQLTRASALLRGREQALRDSEERFRLVIEGVQDYGIFALDPAGRVVSWNAGAQRIKGWHAEEILGEHFSRFYPPDTSGYLPAEMLAKAASNGAAEDEGWRLRKDGTRFWANVVITALRDENGALKGFAKITRDITERRKSEEALRAAREEAIAANQAKTHFLSRTSHELRTPMSAILGFSQLLELDEERFDGLHRDAIQQIGKAGRHLLSLIDDLLDISSIEAGGGAIELEKIDLGPLMKEAHDLAAPLVEAAGLQFLLEVQAVAIRVAGDRRRILQVILNLVTNAAKYNTLGSYVQLSCHRDGKVAVVAITDDGPGVEPDKVARLFTPFDRLGHQSKNKADGTGLGLALSKGLVSAMGGEIGYRPGRPGSTFWFTLPAILTETSKRPRSGSGDVKAGEV